jgi:hypothetical protein
MDSPEAIRVKSRLKVIITTVTLTQRYNTDPDGYESM